MSLSLRDVFTRWTPFPSLTTVLFTWVNYTTSCFLSSFFFQSACIIISSLLFSILLLLLSLFLQIKRHHRDKSFSVLVFASIHCVFYTHRCHYYHCRSPLKLVISQSYRLDINFFATFSQMHLQRSLRVILWHKIYCFWHYDTWHVHYFSNDCT